MKSLLCALILAFIVIFGGLYTSKKIDTLTENLLNKNANIITLINQNDFKSAKEQLKKIHNEIEDSSLVLASCLDHNEIDKIDINIANLKTYIEEENKIMALSCTSTLELLFSHLPKDYHVKLENIF